MLRDARRTFHLAMTSNSVSGGMNLTSSRRRRIRKSSRCAAVPGRSACISTTDDLVSAAKNEPSLYLHVAAETAGSSREC